MTPRLPLVLALVLCMAAPLSAEYVRSHAVHRAFLKATGFPHGRPGYVADHIFPLCAGGKDAVANLQWQTVAEGKVKDREERTLCAAIRRFNQHWRPTP